MLTWLHASGRHTCISADSKRRAILLRPLQQQPVPRFEDVKACRRPGEEKRAHDCERYALVCAAVGRIRFD
eukprot:1292869-Pleurochrysis_carterae.AAC.1